MDAKKTTNTTYQLSVVSTCFNEEKNVVELVERLLNVFQKKAITGEIVLVDDGSTDNTAQVIAQLQSQHPNIVLIQHKTNRGIEQGWRTGVNSSQGEYVCLIDSDLQNLPEDVWRLYREISSSNIDVVQGFRSTIGRLKDSRYILSLGLNFLLNFMFNMRHRDNKSGFLICRKEILVDILRHRFKYKHYQSFIAVAANAKGYTIREIETLFESRLSGKSFLPKIPLIVIFQVMVDVLKAVFEFRILGQQEDVLRDFLSTHEHVRTKEKNTLPGWRRWYFKIYMFFMPLHHWLISHQANRYYEELKKSQWLSLEEMKKLQEIKLRKLVHHAYHHVPYYRQCFDQQKIKPSDIQTIDDLQKIPLLNKSHVRENLYFDLMSDNHNKNKILKITTSGSTGEPFVCYADKHQLELRWAATQRSMEWTGYRFGDRQVRLWHQTIGMSWSQILRECIDAWFNRRMFVPAFEMTSTKLKTIITKIRNHKPMLIDGYAESFNFLARYAKEHSIEGIHPKGIISSAQILPAQSREIIENQFKCKVFDKYGSREFSGIAYECDQSQGHHVVSENYIVEILKNGSPAQPGEMGEVVITDLNNYCMPFIRYRIGDLAVAMDNASPCPCNRGLIRIGKIEGRVQAIIQGTNGCFMPGTFFSHFFKDYDHIIRQYQIHQEEWGKVNLKIIKAPRFDDKTFDHVLSELKSFLGEKIKIEVKFVNKIPMVRTGKHQGSISSLPIDFQKINQDSKH